MENSKSLQTLEEENRRLLRAVEELSILNDLARLIGGSMNSQEIMQTIIHRSLRAVHAEQGVITLVDEQANKPMRTLVRSMQSSGDHPQFHLMESILGWMLLHKKPLMINDPLNDDRFRGLRWDAAIKSVLCVPLTIKAVMIGILTAYNKKDGTPFTDDDQRVMAIIAGQSAQVVENARLHEQEKNLLVKQEEQNLELLEMNKQLEKVTEELKRKVDVFYKFVPNNFLKVLHLEDNYDSIRLGHCVERTMTIMFSDIRSFTSLSEHMTPEQNFRFINSYFSFMGPVIRKNEGFIDKYIGDAIMALFEDADTALSTAILMIQNLFDYNHGRQQAGYAPVSIGVGLNSGSMMLGTIGEDDRMDTTVIGDVVNLASRVESLTKTYNALLLITENTFQNLKHPEKYSIRQIDTVKIRGKDDPVTIFEILDVLPPELRKQKMAIAKSFSQALDAFKQNEFEKALKLFEQCAGQCPDDKPAQIHMDRCREAMIKSKL
ncbi:GAF domain-containing protein [bacterium]|nr:GAF domain-containing protein [bacterium]